MLVTFVQRVFILISLFSFTSHSFTASDSAPALQVDYSRTIKIALPDQSTIDAAAPENAQLLVNFLKEYWQIWSIDNELSIEFFYMPTAQAIEELNNGDIDIISINTFREEYANILYSIPFAKYKQSLFRNINSNETDGIHVAIHSPVESTLNFLPKHIERSYFTDTTELLNPSSDYDAIYSTRPWLLEKELESLGLQQRYYVNQGEVPDVSLHFSTRQNDRALLYLINQSLRQIKPVQAQLWSEKYLTAEENNFVLMLGQYLNNLTEKQQQFVIDNSVIRYPITHDGFPPFIITKNFANINVRGFAADLIRMATEKIGIIFQPMYVDNFEQVIKEVNKGAAELLVNVEYTKSREQDYSFSRPYLKAHYSVAYNPATVTIDQFSAIGKHTIAVVKDFNSTTLLQQRFSKALYKTFPTIEEAIKAVADGDAQVFVGRSLTTSYLIKENRLSNLTSQPIPSFHSEAQFTFATTKQHQTLIPLLNRTISTISADRYDELYAKWSQSAFPQANIQAQVAVAYRQASYVFSAIMLVALIIFWIYYRQLRARKVAQKKIEHALALAQAARKEAEESANAKISFLTRMSHEIRTPMNGVLGMTEALNYTPLDQEQSELLETLEGSARHLLALLNDVLDFSKMDAGKLTLESVPVNLHLLTKNIIKSFKHILQHNAIDINLDIDSNITHSYFTDPTRLNQILNNLVSNAVKFTEKGAITLSIQILEQSNNNDETFDTLRIAVTDTGIGISPQKQKLLFTPFIQADDDTTRKFGGTGLGLSICQEIVIAMGGEIHISSKEGAGSEFYFDLTFKQAGFEKAFEDRRKHDRSKNKPIDDRFKAMRVLIAEDNLVNVKVLSAQLERLNIIADIAYDGVEAFEKHQNEPYDIIISDCHMPNMDGFELAGKIAALGKERIWLIAVTADALSGAVEKCMAAGFDDYMAKPCPQEEITNKLNHAYRAIQQKRNTITPLPEDSKKTKR